MVMGLPGSGKTYFAKAFSKRIGGMHINSDITRKNLDKHPKYGTADKTVVYKAMFKKVCQALEKDKIVVVDATFSLQQYRRPYFDFIQKNKISLRLILIEADEHTIAHRLQKKRPDSDADFAIYKKIKSEFEPLNIAFLRLRSDQQSLEEMIEQSLSFVSIPSNHD